MVRASKAAARRKRKLLLLVGLPSFVRAPAAVWVFWLATFAASRILGAVLHGYLHDLQK